MKDPAQIASAAEDLYRDYSFESVRNWRERTGGLAVGYMPAFAPRELLHSIGVLPVAITGGGDDVEIIRGDAYYQSYICHIPRSTIELGLNGSLDCLEGMIFPATCDVIRNLSGIWKLSFPDKLSFYLDVPQDFDPEMGGEFHRHELLELTRDLTARGAREYDADSLRLSIQAYNRQRQLVRELYELRRQEPWKIPTSELYTLLRASLVVPVDEGTAMFEEYRAAIDGATERVPMDQARVLLAGSFCEQPPLGLLKTLERAGCYLVDDDLLLIHRWMQSDVSVDGDPLANLVQAFLDDSIPSPVRYVETDEKGQELVDRVEEYGAEGVLFCAPSFCDPALLEQPLLIDAVENAHIPWTAFKYSENTGQFQVIREQAGTFADSIKLWS